jgi:hypothetical protein
MAQQLLTHGDERRSAAGRYIHPAQQFLSRWISRPDQPRGGLRGTVRKVGRGCSAQPIRIRLEAGGEEAIEGEPVLGVERLQAVMQLAGDDGAGCLVDRFGIAVDEATIMRDDRYGSISASPKPKIPLHIRAAGRC